MHSHYMRITNLDKAIGSDCVSSRRRSAPLPALCTTLVRWDGRAGVFWRKIPGAAVLGVVVGVAQRGISVFVYRPCGSVRAFAARRV
jgi:hypothetical protein